MPNLNTTVDNIQLKENMITSSEAASAWDTDEKYPTAAAVKQAIVLATSAAVTASVATGSVDYPIGSIIITETNTNPEMNIGGTWELIDKEFKNAFTSLSADDWVESNAIFSEGKLQRDGHIIRLQLWLKTKNVLTTLGGILGTLNRTTCGLDTTKSEGTFVMGSESSVTFATVADDQVDYVVKYFVGDDGLIELKRIILTDDATSLPAESTVCLEFSILANWEGMLDSACDKFYWKHIA